MKFREALTQIIRTESGEYTSNAFYLYSRLSDLCTSFEDREKVSVFFELDKRLHIVNGMQTEGKIAVPVLKAAYPAVKDSLSKASYNGLIDCVAKAVFPNYEKPRTLPPPNRVAQAVVQTAQEEEEPPEPRTPLSSPYGRRKSVWKPIVFLTAILAVIAGIVCLVVFRKQIPWTVWQYFIGAGAVLVFAALVFLIALILDDIAYVGIFFLTVAAAIANFVLLCVFRSDYKIIFIWVSAVTIIGGGLSTFLSFGDVEYGWMWASLIGTVLIVAKFVLSIIFL